MTPEDRKAFDVTEERETEIFDSIRKRTASIIGADGRGGTGTFVELKDGRTVLLTARHVVLHCILSGQITVSRFDRPGTMSVHPTAIRIDSGRDAAFLLFDEHTIPGDVVPFANWKPNTAEIATHTPTIVSGVVGEWKELDADTRIIGLTKWLSLWTSITNAHGLDSDGLEYIVCDVDESDPELPKSFKGMSGGSCLSLDQRLLGVRIPAIVITQIGGS